MLSQTEVKDGYIVVVRSCGFLHITLGNFLGWLLSLCHLLRDVTKICSYRIPKRKSSNITNPFVENNHTNPFVENNRRKHDIFFQKSESFNYVNKRSDNDQMYFSITVVP